MGYTIIPSDEGVAVAVVVSTYLGAVGVEYAVARASGRSVHRLSDSLANLACGAAHQIANLYYVALVACGYEVLRRHFAITRIERFSVITCAAVFLLLDVIYYWEHRLLHRYRWLWASHVVHHQSREFNFTVALRVSILQVWMTTLSILPFAILGFSPAMVLTAAVVSKFYQFWLHTRLIGRLGVLEWVFVTPSHHRVHHARNPRYLDKNFGGMLIVWDRIFGTFELEREPPEYGAAEPVAASFNPVLANLRPWLGLRRSTAAPAPQLAPRSDTASVAVRVSALLRLVAVVGVLMAMLVSEPPGIARWLVLLPVSFVWLWRQGRVLDGQRANPGADMASVVLAVGAGLVLAVTGTATPVVNAALLGGSVLIVLASMMVGRRVTMEDPDRGGVRSGDTPTSSPCPSR